MRLELGEHRSRPLLFFHAFTGCDVISFFSGRGKKSEWHVWEVLPELTDAFLELASSPVNVSEDIMPLIENLWSFGMIEQVNLEQLMKQDNIFFVDYPEHWKIYLQLQLLFGSTLYVLHIRLDMCGGKPFKMTRLPSPADWGWQKSGRDWKPEGAPLSKLKKHVMSSHTVACRGL